MKKHPLWQEDRLGAESEFYKDKAGVYEQFSQAEDMPGKVAAFLATRVVGKVVLDFGCGTGKFIPALAPLSRDYFAVDVSECQLAFAQKKTKSLSNVTLMRNTIDAIPLPAASVDVVCANWVVGSIHNLDVRKTMLKELHRVLKAGGSLYVIENDIGGEFKNIIEADIGEEKTRIKQEWLVRSGFKRIQSFETFFKFQDLDYAKEIFKIIWGDAIAAKVKSPRITHAVCIYERVK